MGKIISSEYIFVNPDRYNADLTYDGMITDFYSNLLPNCRKFTVSTMTGLSINAYTAPVDVGFAMNDLSPYLTLDNTITVTLFNYTASITDA